MTKELEALKRIRQETCPATYMDDFDKNECCYVIEQALLRLESIDNSNPSEALKLAELLECDLQATNDLVTRTINGYDYLDILETIKQELLKAQEEHKALEILKKNFEFGLFEEDKYKVYIYSSDDDYSVVKRISEEEFNLLKEVLE